MYEVRRMLGRRLLSPVAEKSAGFAPLPSPLATFKFKNGNVPDPAADFTFTSMLWSKNVRPLVSLLLTLESHHLATRIVAQSGPTWAADTQADTQMETADAPASAAPRHPYPAYCFVVTNSSIWLPSAVWAVVVPVFPAPQSRQPAHKWRAADSSTAQGRAGAAAGSFNLSLCVSKEMHSDRWVLQKAAPAGLKLVWHVDASRATVVRLLTAGRRCRKCPRLSSQPHTRRRSTTLSASWRAATKDGRCSCSLHAMQSGHHTWVARPAIGASAQMPLEGVQHCSDAAWTSTAGLYQMEKDDVDTTRIRRPPGMSSMGCALRQMASLCYSRFPMADHSHRGTASLSRVFSKVSMRAPNFDASHTHQFAAASGLDGVKLPVTCHSGFMSTNASVSCRQAACQQKRPLAVISAFRYAPHVFPRLPLCRNVRGATASGLRLGQLSRNGLVDVAAASLLETSRPPSPANGPVTV
ncbi:uncharacterized protein BDR25DRAFT_339694 [Lindgomyces ingoldianus]|uniref:Uncharacterized protein n=1 Tax=Lindgomyces ingoldianus TaxID=673940 RepID=A0ACB6RBB9_9PLEO|nr:uncharacterized protein BDR25DRAFT_339694 [Lindgomyces ingoldianus]KAF2475640.1 hypothetical protein BDR25DRAFT_339694 [Lindgomyces ingoldianus]